MNDITPKEAIANLNHIYGMVSPDIQRSLDVAIKALERPIGDLISREALKKTICLDEIISVDETWEQLYDAVVKAIDNAPTVPQVTVFTETADEKAVADLKAELQSVIEPRPQGKWILQSRTPGFFGRDDVDNFKCSVCGKITSHTYVGVVENEITPYCPQCGVSMSKDIERMF